MSVNDTNSSSSDTLTAEFRDGRLQIVEYSPASGEGEQEDQVRSEDVESNYIHIVNETDNQGWQLGNLNFTIARCDEQNNEGDFTIIADDSEQLPQEFVLKSNSNYSVQQEIKPNTEDDSSSYVIMFNPDADDDDDGEYVVLEDQPRSGTGNDSYVVVHGKDGPMVFLQSQLEITQQPPEPTVPKKVTTLKTFLTRKTPSGFATQRDAEKKGDYFVELRIYESKEAEQCAPDQRWRIAFFTYKSKITKDSEPIPTALELLKKAKAVKKAKALLRTSLCSIGRGRTHTLPSAEQLLHSPDFKIYLYSCKMCDFQCNQIKQMTEHKAKEHLKKRGNNKTRYPYKNSLGGGRSMQCARCPYRATVISDLLNHAKETHPEEGPDKEAVDCNLFGVQPTVQDDVENHTCTQDRAKEDEQAKATKESFICQLCGEHASTQDELDTHIEDQHPVTLLCA